ncbi:MAG: metallophosphoesterase, partial [Firmicutes bacterium]|nr:metallophosphoesterase [Bacillota bacterium]
PFRAALARAHLVALTGDYFTLSLPRAQVAAALATLEAPYGVWAVSGNHDYHRGRLRLEPWRPRAAWLDNRAVAVERGGSRLWLAGIPDLVRGRPRLAEVAAACTGPEPAVLLSHRPDVITRPEAARFALVLAGHTHGGQVTLPGGRALVRHTRLPAPYVAGRLEHGGTVLITSRGLGTSELPVRLGARPEVVEVRLYSKPGTEVANHA